MNAYRFGMGSGRAMLFVRIASCICLLASHVVAPSESRADGAGPVSLQFGSSKMFVRPGFRRAVLRRCDTRALKQGRRPRGADGCWILGRGSRLRAVDVRSAGRRTRGNARTTTSSMFSGSGSVTYLYALSPGLYQVSVTFVNPFGARSGILLKAQDIVVASNISVPAGGSFTAEFLADTRTVLPRYVVNGILALDISGIFAFSTFRAVAAPPPTPTPSPAATPRPTDSSGSVSSLTLINADSNLPVPGFDPIVDGAVLDIGVQPSAGYSVRANVAGSPIGSVRFGLDGNASFRVENQPPFALGGDASNGTDYLPVPELVTPGTHTIAGTVFPQPAAAGSSGPTTRVSLTIRRTAAATPTATPAATPAAAPTATPTATPAASATPTPAAGDPTAQRLVAREDIQWLGAFRLPSGSSGTSRFGYGGAAPGYYKDAANRQTLFMEGHIWYPGNVAQVEIPQISTSRDINSLPRAGLLQAFADVTDGHLGGRSGDRLGSTMPYNGRLIVGSYVYYDGDAGQQRFIGSSSFNLATSGDFRGFYTPSGINPGRLGRYMSMIPPEWQARFGAPAMSGACCLSIISRTSFGPGVSVFNPDDVGANDWVPFKEVLGYPMDHAVRFGSDQGSCSGQSSVFNCTTSMVGLAFPVRTRSVLFFGAQGTGPVCYKEEGPASCRGTGGYNAPPYRSQVWAYDANQLLLVKSGHKQPWEVQPYAVWQLDFEFRSGGVQLTGGTFDPETNRVFLIEQNGEDPIVHVLKINTL